MDLGQTIERISRLSQESFARKNAVLSFSEYLGLLAQRPYTITRNAAQYLRDAFDHFGSYEVPGMGGTVRRWAVFDDLSGDGLGQVFGHESIQNRLYEILTEFVQRGQADRFTLMHGPNGSAKSSLVLALIQALERYSLTEEGPLFRLSWIFCEAGHKEPVGFERQSEIEDLDSFARVDERLVTSRIPCEMKDPPFFLLPRSRRREFFEAALAEAPESERTAFDWTETVLRGELAPKNKVIFESLLKAYGGDWQRVVRHVRVERFYLSRAYRTGAVSIEPQTTIDAATAMLSHASSRGLPPILANETLLEARGDLIDANAGVVEYSDFLKRNPEANKYLLTTAERGFLNLPGLTVSLNLVMCGGTNEKFLAAFKRDPSFPSFKGRFDLVRVPYLVEYTKESEIYARHLTRIGGRKIIDPHTARVAALWAILTRLRRPDPEHYEGDLARIARRIGPLDKARLYAFGILPAGLPDGDKKILRENIGLIAAEYDGLEEQFEKYVDAAYEGRRGASAREMMNLLTEIVVESEAELIGPVDVFEHLPRAIADPSLYSYLRRAKDGDYSDPQGFIDVVRKEYVRWITGEVRKASDLVEETEYHRLFNDYVRHVKAFGTGEKIASPQSGEPKDPDEQLMQEVERHLGIDEGAAEFRSNLISKVAAFRLTHPDKPLDFETLFADHFHALEQSFYRERTDRIMAMAADALELQGSSGEKMVPERRAAAEHLVQRLVTDFGYPPKSVAPMLSYLYRHYDAHDAG